MAKHIIFTALIFSLWLPVWGQTGTSNEILEIQTDPVHPTQVVLSEVKEDWFPFLRNTLKTPENPNPDKIKAAALKAEANRKWAKVQADRTTPYSGGSASRTTIDPPVLGTNFLANNVDGFPNDNDIAVARSGIIVSTTNSRINVYDSTGTLLLTRSLGAFTSTISTLSPFKYDPRVVYDPGADKFIVAFLSGSQSGNSQIVVAFSQTNDPTQTWNIYALNGNLQPNGIQVWTDYPAIGISEFDLFVTGNLFTNGGGSSPGAGLWQIRLLDGYGANVLAPKVYSLNGVFSLTPVTGSITNYGPNFFLIGKPGFTGGNQFVLYEVDNRLAAGGLLKPPLTFTAPENYGFPPDLSQKGSATMLTTGDGRIAGAFRMGDNIYFTFGTSNRAGEPAIYLGHLVLSPIAPTFSRMNAYYITSDTLQFAYPSVTYGGESTSDDKHSLIVAANSASVDHFPGNSAIYVDPDGNISAPLICKTSPRASPQGNIGPNQYRWGDYTDVATAKAGEAWVSGYYFNSTGRNLTWLSKVNIPKSPPNTAIDPKEAQNVGNLTIYPNPATELIYFDFEVSKSDYYKAIILDDQGRRVHVLIEDFLTKGEAKVGLNTAVLSSGTYFISVENKETRLLSKSFVVTN